MIRIQLIEARDGSHIAEVFSPYVPTGMVLQLNLGEVTRDFYVEKVYESVFTQDGFEGISSLTSVSLCVTETMDSRKRNQPEG